MFKQVMVVREDLKLSKGKLSVQVSHASVAALKKVEKNIISKWETEGSKKVVLRAQDERHLLELKKRADSMKVSSALIKDAGLTELPPGTTTCLGIGPDEEEKINKITGSLPLL